VGLHDNISQMQISVKYLSHDTTTKDQIGKQMGGQVFFKQKLRTLLRYAKVVELNKWKLSKLHFLIQFKIIKVAN